MFLDLHRLLLLLLQLEPPVTLSDVFGEADEAVQLLAAPTNYLPGDEEDDAIVAPQPTLQLFYR